MIVSKSARETISCVALIFCRKDLFKESGACGRALILAKKYELVISAV